MIILHKEKYLPHLSYIIPILFTSGIVGYITPALLPIMIILVIIALTIGLYKLNISQKTGLILGIFCILIIGLGVLRTSQTAAPKIQALQKWETKAHTFKIKNATNFNEKTRYTLTENEHRWTLIWTTPKYYPIGTQFLAQGKIITYPPATNPGQFNPQLHARSKDIAGKFEPKNIISITPPTMPSLTTLANALHQKILTTNQHILPVPYGDILTAFVFGNQNTEVPQEWAAWFQKLGLIHLLVVSGAQVALLNMVVLNLIKSLKTQPKIRWLILLIINIFFYLVTGGGISIARACWMAQIAFGALVLKRNTPTLSILGIAALPLLVISPWCITQIGFQLSFLATFALVWASPILKERLAHLPHWMATLLSPSIAAFIFTTPCLWFYFQTISWVSIFCNTIITPIAEILVITGVAGSLLSLIHPSLALIPLHASWAILLALKIITSTLSKIPYITSNLAHPESWSILLLYGLILISFSLLPNHKKPARLATIITFIFFILLLVPSKKSDLTVTILDVGQGDSIVIKTPKHTILIDTGNHIHTPSGYTFDAAKEVIYPYLHYYGITTIDAVILTHSDQDHIGGLPYLLTQIPIKKVINNGYLETQEPELTQQIKSLSIPLIAAKKGEWITLENNVKINLLFPDESVDSTAKTNDQSIVTKLSFKKFNILFTGDLEASGENHLVETAAPLQSQFLKLGHHGSKTSSTAEFLDYVHPQYAIVSAGRKNTYHHPHPSVMVRVNNRHIKVFRTDQQGAISILTNGDTTRIKTFL